MKYVLAGVAFALGLVMAGGDGAWFPLPNFIGIALMFLALWSLKEG